jgi:hypothetical protein
MDFHNWISIVEIAALTGSWVWLRTRRLQYPDWRRKASLAALGCVSLTVLLDVMNSGVLHLILTDRVSRGIGLALLAAIRPLVWATVTTACLALVLGLAGRGTPRILALAWVCVLCIPSASILPAVGSGLYGRWREEAPIRNRLAVLAGEGAINCGTVRPRTDPESCSNCVLKSFGTHKPFYAVYDTQEISIDSHFIDGLAGDKSGNLYNVEFGSRGSSSEGLSDGTQLVDGGHIFVEPCSKPITLSKSIYKGLTCIPRIMDRPSGSK